MPVLNIPKVRAKELLQKSIDTIADLEKHFAGSDEFVRWKRMTEVNIAHIFPAGERHLDDFKKISYSPAPPIAASVGRDGRIYPPPPDPKPFYQVGLKRARSILDSMNEEIDTIWDEPVAPTAAPTTRTTEESIETICYRFHAVARELRRRHSGRPTIEINDEYDAQDLIRSLLQMFFDDVRAEEWTGSYAGKASRIDFLLKKEKAGLEIKHSRPSLTEKELGDELIVDIARYKASHPDVQMLYCFVYDPGGYIHNPRGIENDLSREIDGMPVKVIISPKPY